MIATAKDLRQSCRAAVLELRQLEDQLQRCLPTGKPSGVKAQQYDAPPPGTNDPTAAALQLYEGLVAQRKDLALQVSLIGATAWRIISTQKNVRAMAILNGYYLLGQTDQEIARQQNLSREHVCRLRHEALDALDSPPINTN